MKRLFIAVKIKPDQAFLADYHRLRIYLGDSNIAWVDAGLMHLTLKFLGKTDEGSISKINSVLAEVAAEYETFDTCFDKLGIFGSSYQPKVIWLGANNPTRFAVLGEMVIDRLDKNGFSRDRQNFVPHITLGRIKKIDDKKFFNEMISRFHGIFRLQVFVVQMLLYHSELTSSGPRYHEISAFNMRL